MTVRHILWIVVDCLRADHLGCYGYGRDTSPAIDRLAGNGTRFAACYPQGIYTFPAHISMLASLHHITHRLHNGESLLFDVALLPDILKEQGFATGGFVSNGMLAGDFGFRRHFDYYDDGILSHDDRKPTFSRPAADTTSEALEWLQRQASERTFLFMHYNDAHAPYIVPPEYASRFRGDALDNDRRELPIAPGERDVIRPSDAIGDEREVGFYVAQYDAAIRLVDDHIAQVLAPYDTLGLRDETLVIVTGDHGEALGEHGYFFTHGKAFYEEFLRVPLIVAGPGIPPGQTISGPVRHIDIAPTVLSALGLPQPERWEGRPLLPVGAGDREAALPVVDVGPYSAYLRDGRWKYIRTRDYALAPPDQISGLAALKQRAKQLLRQPREALYDLESDPGERRNLASAEPQLVDELHRKLTTLLTSNGHAPLVRRAAEDGGVSDDVVQERLKALGYID